MRQLKIVHKITNRESVSLDKYLQEIGKIDLLTPEEEVNLAGRIREGDEEALEKLTKANLRFVVSVAKQYQGHGLSLSDLINEGNVGLMKAARRFDETKGFKFISYAVWWIRQSIIQAIIEYSRIVRLPMNKMANYKKVNDAYLSFVQEFEREPTHEEIADLLNMTEKEVMNLLDGSKYHLSFDAPVSSEGDDNTLLDMMAFENEESPDLKLMEESLTQEVKQGLAILSPREVDVLTAYYGLNGKESLNLEEIGELYDLTRERVRQIKERAIRRLRRSLRKNSLRSYL